MTTENENKIEGDKIKVLIVDDDKFLLNMYAIKFKNNGYDVDTACGGDEALDKLKNGAVPNILITDLIMPRMDGFAFLEAVKEAKLAETAVRIVLTNQGQTSDIQRANQLGVDGYIVKATTIPSEVVDEVLTIYRGKKGIK